MFDQCHNGNIYHYSDKYVLLLDKKFRSGQWCEYYTFALSKALSEALNKGCPCEKAKGLDGGREASFVKINMKGTEYKCSMKNDGNGDSFIIKKDEEVISLDTLDEWKEECLKIIEQDE